MPITNLGLLVGQLLQGKRWRSVTFRIRRVLALQASQHANIVPESVYAGSMGWMWSQLPVLREYVLRSNMDAGMGKISKIE